MLDGSKVRLPRVGKSGGISTPATRGRDRTVSAEKSTKGLRKLLRTHSSLEQGVADLSQADQALQRDSGPFASATWTAAIVPGLVVSTPPSPNSSVFAHLWMWPLLGHPWRSSSSVCASRGSGSKRFPFGVCSGASVNERVLDIADHGGGR